MSANGNTFLLGLSTSAPLNVSVRGKYSGTSDQVGVMARRTASNTYYRAGLRNGQFEIRLNNAGTVSLLVGQATTALSPNPFTFATGTFYWIKFDLNGSTLQAKVWPDGNTEPASYQISVTNTTISAAGGFGIFGLVSPTSDIVTFDTFLATDRGTPHPTLSTTPGTLSFSAIVGGANPASQNDTLAETAGIGTAWTSSISYGSGSGWLAISPTSGTLSASGTQTVAYTCTTGALVAGTYTATVTYTATTGGATATVVVTFVVSPALATYSNYKNTIEPNLLAALSAKSLLSHVQVIGPDTTMANDSWLTSASTDLSSTLSGYVRHAFPTQATDISGGSLEVAAKSLVSGIYANDNTSKPVIQGEMGFGAQGPGQSVALYQYGVEMADYAVQLARAGMAALIAYDLDDDMHGTEWGMWGGVAAWFDTNYSYKKSLTIDHTKVSGGSDLSSFPVLISMTDADLKTSANGGKIQNSSGFDLIFVDSTNSTKLDHEIEKYVAATGEIEMWVRIPTLSHTADTVIYLYFDNSGIASSQENKTGVWDSNFKRVYHLGDGTTLSLADSTSNAQNGTNNGATAASGQIDGGAQIASDSSYISLPTTGLPTGANSFSVSFWINSSQVSNGFAICAFGTAGSGTQVALYYTVSSGILNLYTGSSNNSAGSTLSNGSWYQLAITYDGTTLKLYVNGTVVVSVTITLNISYGIAYIGNDFFSEAVHGTYDEIEYSNIARSIGWITTEYNNQNSPGTFVSVGTLTSRTPTSLRPWFFPWSLLTTSLIPGSTLYAPTQPTSNDLRVLAAQTPQGAWTFVLVNRKATTQNIQVVVPFAPVVSTALQVYTYSNVAPLFVDGNGFPLASGTLNTILPRGFTVSLSANAVLILTEATATQTNVFDVKRPPLQKRR